MNSKLYKWCAVPQCGNTSIKTPNKLFVLVPFKKKIREQWLKLANRNANDLLPRARLYFCEDHFDMPNDMMETVPFIRMKPGCVPTRFHCQLDKRKKTLVVTKRSHMLLEQKKMLPEESVRDLEEKTFATEPLELDNTSSLSEGLSQELGAKDVAEVKMGPSPCNIHDTVEVDGIKIEQNNHDAEYNGEIEIKQEIFEVGEDLGPHLSLGLDKIKQEFVIAKIDNQQEFKEIPLHGLYSESNEIIINSHVQFEHEATKELVGVITDPDCLKSVLDLIVMPKKQKIPIKNCIVCQKYFRRNTGYKMHLIEHLFSSAYGSLIENFGLKCQLCGQVFNNPHHYKYHMRDHAFLQTYECKLCDTAFSNSSNCVKHKRSHNFSGCVCDFCQRKLKTKDSLEHHMWTKHYNTEPLKCKKCSKKFHFRPMYLEHLKKAHSEPRLKFTCPFCQLTLSSLSKRQEHMWSVHGNRQFKADSLIYNKPLRTVLDLQSHSQDLNNIKM